MPSTYDQLVNKALAAFHIKQKMSFSSSDDESFLHPFITVAREPGSGGKPIAEEVARRLGFEFIDKQIINEIARSTRKRKAVIKEIDEKSRSKIDDMVHSVLNKEYVDESAYITGLVQVVMAYAHKGHCVILGRGSNFITPFGRGLHVNITAPYVIRVQRAMDFEGHSEQKAKRIIAKIEKERVAFVKQYFGSNLKQRNVFDLTLNTAYFTVPRAAEVVIKAFEQKFK